MKRLKVLMSAYSCEPNKGSEPGVGWNVAREMAKYHDVWVITRANNRSVVEAKLAQNPEPNLHFVFYDLPNWLCWWKRGGRGVELYYYLWQMQIYFIAKRLHQQNDFDLVHHLTFGRYWSPSFLAHLPIPFVWGPLGGGESAPKTFWRSFKLHGMINEIIRDMAREWGSRDPFVHRAARRCALAICSTEETATRVRQLGAPNVRLLLQMGILKDEIERLSQVKAAFKAPIRFISMARLLHWKGLHLSLQAFAQADLKDAEYWIIGDGPERRRLELLTEALDIVPQVRFFGALPREEALHKLSGCHVLVHPSLHDQSPTVVLEAMAAGRPVICLDLGGPALQVTEKTGFKIAALDPEQTIIDLALAMRRLASDGKLWLCMGMAGRKHVAESYSWERKSRLLRQVYAEVLGSVDIVR